MPERKKDIHCLTEVAKEYADDNHPTKQTEVNDSSNEPIKPSGKVSSQENSVRKNSKNQSGREKPILTFKELAAKKKNQNLAERKVLLIILAVLLGLQLLFMNAVVLLIVLWSLFEFECFRVLDAEVLKAILEFTKYYVTAVLVELLGGIIYIVHRVFSDQN